MKSTVLFKTTTSTIVFLLVGLMGCEKNNHDNSYPDPFANCAAITANTTVPEGTYTIDCEVEVKNNAVLTLQPGVVLRFTSNGAMVTSGGGAISAVGTSAKPILFSGREAIKGYWIGVDINTNSMLNQFNYCYFEYGGKGPRSMVRLGGDGSTPAKAAFKNCHFRNGKKNGLFVNEFSSMAGSENNVFTGNDEYPVSVAYQNVNEINNSNSYTGNAKDMVLVYTDEISASIDVSVTFNKIEIPYFLSNTAPYLFKQLVNVKPGVTLLMEANNALRIDATGSFYCVGTPTDRITIKGLQPVKGYWDRITFKGSPSPNNRLEYTDISDGGANTTESGLSSQPGVITTPGSGLGDGTNLNIKNSSITNSKFWAIYLNGIGHTVNGVTGSANIKSSLEGNGNTYNNNSSGNVFVN